jgi:hypothetical protein
MKISNILPVLHIRSIYLTRRLAICAKNNEELGRFVKDLPYRWRDTARELREMRRNAD